MAERGLIVKREDPTWLKWPKGLEVWRVWDLRVGAFGLGLGVSGCGAVVWVWGFEF